MAIPTTVIVITPTDLMDHFNKLNFVDNPLKDPQKFMLICEVEDVATMHEGNILKPSGKIKLVLEWA